MEIETLNKANAILKLIDKLESEKRFLEKCYSKKENLKKEEILEIFNIAMSNTSYTLKKFEEELKKL